jgi:hypothetical protein
MIWTAEAMATSRSEEVPPVRTVIFMPREGLEMRER